MEIIILRVSIEKPTIIWYNYIKINERKTKVAKITVGYIFGSYSHILFQMSIVKNVQCNTIKKWF